jgi:ankyrin repeat protein
LRLGRRGELYLFTSLIFAGVFSRFFFVILKKSKELMEKNRGISMLKVVLSAVFVLLTVEQSSSIAVGTDGRTPLDYAVRSGDIAEVRRLIRLGADIRAVDNDCYKRIVLHYAVDSGDENMVRYVLFAYLKTGADVNVSDAFGGTPLHNAVVSGNIGIINTLIQYCVDINANNRGGVTLLHCAKNTDVIECLVSYGANVNAVTFSGETPLHFAGNAGVVECLVSLGANVNVFDAGGVTPLHLAVQGGYGDIVRYLVFCGANVNAATKKRKTPLYMAVRQRKEAVVNFLMNNGAV